jgi:hypothetical protein
MSRDDKKRCRIQRLEVALGLYRQELQRFGRRSSIYIVKRRRYEAAHSRRWIWPGGQRSTTAEHRPRSMCPGRGKHKDSIQTTRIAGCQAAKATATLADNPIIISRTAPQEAGRRERPARIAYCRVQVEVDLLIAPGSQTDVPIKLRWYGRGLRT